MEIESDKPIRIGNFHPPQIKVAKTGKYKELTDETYNTQSVQVVSVHKQYFEGSGNLTKEFDEDMHGLSIYNNHTEIMRFVIDDVSIPVFPKNSWSDVFKDSFRSVSIIATGPWYIMPLQRIGAAASIVEPEPPDTTAPDNVTDLAYNNVTQNSAVLTWLASTSPDTTGYDVWQGGALLTTVQAPSTTYTAVNLNAQTQYTFTIKARDGAGNVASGTSINVTTIAQPLDTTPPNNVTGLDKSNVTQTGVVLSWVASDSVDLKDYRIYNGSTLVATVTALTYGVTGLSASNNYTFTVKARDMANNEASGTSVSVTTLAPADTTAPILTITPAATFEDTHQVVMSTNEPADIRYTLNGSTPTTADTNYTTALTLTETTTVKAFAKDLAGNQSAVQTVVYTKDAEAPPDTEAPEPVSDLTAGTPTATTIPITFTPSTSDDVAALEVAYSLGDVNYTVSSLVNPSSTSYVVRELTADTSYNIRVIAIDWAGNRSEEVTVQATTTTAAYASDEFDRPDTNITAQGTQTLGTTEVGSKVWVNTSQFLCYGTKNGMAHLQFTGTGGVKHRFPTVIPVNLPNYAIEVIIPVLDTVQANESIFIRRNAGSDIVYLKKNALSYELFKQASAGTPTLIKVGNIAPVAGQKIRIEAYEDGRIRWFINGVLEYEPKEPLALAASTSVGFASDTVVSMFDKFEVFTIPAIPADVTPPAEVTNITTSGVTQTAMNIAWTHPLDKDLKQVEVYIADVLVGTAIPTTMSNNISQFVIVSGLTANTSYTFTIKTRDWSGNLSNGVQITKTTASGAE